MALYNVGAEEGVQSEAVLKRGGETSTHLSNIPTATKITIIRPKEIITGWCLCLQL